MGIGGDGGIDSVVVVLIVMAVVRVTLVIRSNLFYVHGVICGGGSCIDYVVVVGMVMVGY